MTVDAVRILPRFCELSNHRVEQMESALAHVHIKPDPEISLQIKQESVIVLIQRKSAGGSSDDKRHQVINCGSRGLKTHLRICKGNNVPSVANPVTLVVSPKVVEEVVASGFCFCCIEILEFDSITEKVEGMTDQGASLEACMCSFPVMDCWGVAPVSHVTSNLATTRTQKE
ncbi:hypothetical protein NDU88_000521 [Pleurodeles waltl]|uniref:Uncharacterized protein n=1 Tax=Pleurodeles waltl TaxID=8319 RepID=A0AAV7KP50_PLEWA|nr:hypothetical protein NDU88_000521 [Pleurodeles waltl]